MKTYSSCWMQGDQHSLHHEHPAPQKRGAPTVQGVTGIQVRETVPDWVLQRVNEVVMIDLTPEALQARMRRRRHGHFFRETDLIALRELRQVAQQVDLSLEGSAESKRKSEERCHTRTHCGVHQLEPGGAVSGCARGAQAHAMNAELFVVYTDLGQTQRSESADPRRDRPFFAENVGDRRAAWARAWLRQSLNSSTRNTSPKLFSDAPRRGGGNDTSIFPPSINFCATLPR